MNYTFVYLLIVLSVARARILEFKVLEVRNLESEHQSEIMGFTKEALKVTTDTKELSEMTTDFMHQEYVPELGEHAFCGVDLPEEFYSTIEYDKAYKMIRFHDAKTNLVISCWIYKHLLF